MSTSTTWRDISEGSAVILKRQRYVVTNYARDGKRATVTVKGARGSFTTTVKRKDPVELAPASVILKRAPEVSPTLPYGGSLHDPSGAQRRWAEPGEVRTTSPPRKPRGAPGTSRKERPSVRSPRSSAPTWSASRPIPKVVGTCPRSTPQRLPPTYFCTTTSSRHHCSGRISPRCTPTNMPEPSARMPWRCT